MGASTHHVDVALAAIGAEHERQSPTTWRVEVPTVARRSISVGMAAHERTLRLYAFVLRAPDRDHVGVYRLMLRTNLDVAATGPWRFAIDDDGDVHLVAETPLHLVDTDGLDRLLGAFSALIDATWNGLFRTGFEVPPPG